MPFLIRFFMICRLATTGRASSFLARHQGSTTSSNRIRRATIFQLHSSGMMSAPGARPQALGGGDGDGDASGAPVCDASAPAGAAAPAAATGIANGAAALAANQQQQNQQQQNQQQQQQQQPPPLKRHMRVVEAVSVPAHLQAARLHAALLALLPARFASTTAAKKACRRGEVLLNRERAGVEAQVAAGDLIEVSA